jgi:hypothetical protein
MRGRVASDGQSGRTVIVATRQLKIVEAGLAPASRAGPRKALVRRSNSSKFNFPNLVCKPEPCAPNAKKKFLQPEPKRA